MDVAGLVLVNPCVNITDPRMKILPLLRHLVPSLAAIGNDVADPGAREIAYDRNPLHALHSQTYLWADVVDHLDRVTQPLLVFRSEQDHVADASSLAILKERVASADAEFRTLTRSYHVATLDYEADEIFAASVELFRRLYFQPDRKISLHPHLDPRRRVRRCVVHRNTPCDLAVTNVTWLTS